MDDLRESRRKLVKSEHSRKKRWKRKHCRGKFYRDPFGVGREILDAKGKPVQLDVNKEVLDDYVSKVASDPLRDVDLTPLEGLEDVLVPEVTFPEGQFSKALFDRVLKKK